VEAIASVLIVYFAYLRCIRLSLPVLIFLLAVIAQKSRLCFVLAKRARFRLIDFIVPVQVLCLGRRISVGEAPGRAAISRFQLGFAAQILQVSSFLISPFS
jgi:hypothetical protein